jgi:hypothetical protein
VAHFDSLDLSHHFIAGGINDVDIVSGAIGLDNPEVVRRGPQVQGAQEGHS